jgi:proton-dependent oligopeptide transporter, POT family
MSYSTKASDTSEIPTGIPYIIGNEAAERFSFYGMKAVLYVFITQYLHYMGNEVVDAFSDYEANNIVYTFNIAVYLTPLIGAIIADLWWGKYKTIIYLSIVYCLGHLALAFMGSFGDSFYWLIAGLFLISLGAGGIKPCVSAHVGDQFGPNNQSKLTVVFNWFYFSINLGAAVAGLLTPFLLVKFGPHFAFGLPGVLMALATLMFWLGRRSFVHIPPSGSMFLKAVCSKEGVKILLKLTSIFVFVSVFWALFDQTATTWVQQAQDMNRHIFFIEISPAQIQALNPFLILILIPIFTYGLYPLVNQFFPLHPLRKMSIGFFVTALSFGVCAYIQTMIESGESPHIAWQFLAYLLITSAEIMISIVCLEFAYTQAPKTMKSVIMSVFLVTVALGNFINLGINHLLYAPKPHKNEISEFQEKKKIDPDTRHITIESEEYNAT